MYLTRWSNFERDLTGALATFDRMRQQMSRMSSDWPASYTQNGYGNTTWPQSNLYDNGSELVVCAAVPGMSEKDIQINATSDVLSITGERGVQAPEGYSVHRQERSSVQFSRSFTLPCKVDTENTTAEVKDGMLTIRMAKAQEAQPRQITVKANS